jgi:hypothetical protein
MLIHRTFTKVPVIKPLWSSGVRKNKGLVQLVLVVCFCAGGTLGLCCVVLAIFVVGRVVFLFLSVVGRVVSFFFALRRFFRGCVLVALFRLMKYML